MAAPHTDEDKDKRLTQLVHVFGCPGIVSLRSSRAEAPEQIQYLDLLSKQVRAEAGLLPHAVGEFQGRPVMYFLDASGGEPDVTERLELQQRLANRGDHGVLAVVRPGDLTLYPLNLDRKTLNEKGISSGVRVEAGDPAAPFLFQKVATGDFTLPGRAEDADPVFEEIKKLMDRACRHLVGHYQLNGLDVLSMTGRALFFRFLIDRKIVVDDDLTEICPSAFHGSAPHDLQSAFSSAERAAETSVWLDKTFNGDLLPLAKNITLTTPDDERYSQYLKAYREAGRKSEKHLFRHLEAILRGWENLKGGIQMLLPIDWDDLNFRHIPIGVLSQVYENFSHQVDKADSLERGVHYTPRTLAKLLVDQALAGLDTPHTARVLDPACGAGVFLVLTLRELVRLRWQHDIQKDGEKAPRPGKKIIQNILHKQICGFDISESALRLAALALYITVIELNEITRPPSEHHAEKALRDLVLFDQRTEEELTLTGFVPGSLGAAVDRARFDGAFDIVVANPPWTRQEGVAKDQVDEAGNELARRVLNSRGLGGLAKDYKNPGGIPDIPFLWRAMEWAKPGGIIAFALEARLILAQSNPMVKARSALFQAFSVTGVLNGSDLEKTDVWGCMDQPWILLWARNEKPDLENQVLHLLAPVREDELAKKGEFRLDYQSAYPVPMKEILAKGWLCKALAIGTTLDVQVMDKMVKTAAKQSVGSFWELGKQMGLLDSGQGFGFKSRSDDPPDWLLKLPVFTPPQDGFLIPDLAILKTFGDKFRGQKLELPRRKSLYKHPLVILTEKAGEHRSDPRSYLMTDEDICFSESYYGYSAGGHADGELIVSLLHLIIHSNLFRHFCYTNSAEVGARRRTIQKADINAFPFPAIEKLTNGDRKKALSLANSLNAIEEKDWSELDEFVCHIYRLTKTEQQVVEDTVSFNGPYRSVRKPASDPTPWDEADTFAKTLELALQPFFKVAGQKVKVRVIPKAGKGLPPPWQFVTILLDGDEWTPSAKVIADLMAEASTSAASRVVMPLPGGGLIVGLINKRRFWTRSRARLCALHISQGHLDAAFPLTTSRR